MSKLILSISLLFILNPKIMSSQNNALPEIIAKCKKSIIPVIGSDTNWKNNERHLGTGIVIGDKVLGKEYILTCEHVISIKGQQNKTLKQVDKLYANFNLKDGSTIKIPLTPIYTDEKNDFALLEFAFENYRNIIKPNNEVELLIWEFGNFDNSDSIKEGESILYLGYPMSFGVGIQNYPVSRSGMIAQNIANSSTFLIDGFVQGGNSGSPVFRLLKNSYKLCGIAQAYPKEIASVNFQNNKERDRFAIVNPGFTIVRKINIISEVLKNNFGFGNK